MAPFQHDLLGALPRPPSRGRQSSEKKKKKKRERVCERV